MVTSDYARETLMTELATGYDERDTNFSTTNSTLFATTGTGGANPIIGGLSVTVVGTGAPVEVVFYCPAMGNTASSIVTSYFVVTVGAGSPAVTAATSQYKNWATAQGEGGSMRRRLVLTNGTTYTFQVGLSGSAANISTAYGQVVNGGVGAGVMSLRVTD